MMPANGNGQYGKVTRSHEVRMNNNIGNTMYVTVKCNVYLHGYLTNKERGLTMSVHVGSRDNIDIITTSTQVHSHYRTVSPVINK